MFLWNLPSFMVLIMFIYLLDCEEDVNLDSEAVSQYKTPFSSLLE